MRFTIYDLRFTMGKSGVKSSAKATAVQALREDWPPSHFAERLECGVFTAAFVRGRISAGT